MKTSIKVGVRLFTFGCILSCTTGCVTRSVQVEINDISSKPKTAHIESISVLMPTNAYERVFSIVPLHAEKYSKILADSLQKSFHAANLNASVHNSTPLDLHVIVRGCGEVISTYGMKIAVCVAWCLADSKENILVDDQFYAYSSGMFLYTQQNVRNRLTKTIVQRVGRSCFQSTHGGNAKSLSPPVPYTFERMDMMIDRLPDSATYSNPYQVSIATINWSALMRDKPINWQEHITGKPVANPVKSDAITSPPKSELKTEAVWKRAEAGDAAAQYELGMLYAAGKEVEKDEAEAVKCFLASAEQGYVKAQYVLGVCYAHGRGVEQNKAEAVRWLKKASANGVEQADDLLAKMGYGKP